MNTYVLRWLTETLAVFFTIEEAKAFVEKREGHTQSWQHSDSHGACWTSGKYLIEETPVRSGMDRALQMPEQVIASLINLRDELIARENASCPEVVFKLNSCLFNEYPHRNTIEEFVVVSSRKTKDNKWLWTRSTRKAALGLANTICQSMEADGHKNVTITVLDVAAGTATIYRGERSLATDLHEDR